MTSEECIEKLFKKSPFIYEVDGEYYAFGQLTCKKLDDTIDDTMAKSRLQRYQEALKTEEKQKIFEAFQFVRGRANLYTNKLTNDVEKFTSECFAKLNFGETQMAQLKQQLIDLEGNYKKYISCH